jgi:integrase
LDWGLRLSRRRRAAAKRYGGRGRLLIGVLAVAGPRIGEALALHWGDVSLARGELVVRRSKTEAASASSSYPRRWSRALVEWKARASFLR